MEKYTDEDAIIAFLTSDEEVKLSKPQQKKLERWSFADSCIRRYKARTKVVNMLVSQFDISKATALRDYYSTQQVFASTFRHSRDYHIDLLMESIAETRKVAIATQNPTALARCDANYAHAIEKLLGDKDTPDYEALQPPSYLLQFKPELLGIELLPEKELQKQIQMLERVDKEAKQLPPLNFKDAEEIADYLTLNQDEGTPQE